MFSWYKGRYYLYGIPERLPPSLYGQTAAHERRALFTAGRNTTRVEDIAYCLLGIFDINMPLLYGEGDKAFLRLQQELTRSKNDLTLFAWRQAAPVPIHRGLFANSPTEFQRSRRLKILPGSMLHDTEFSITNRGIRFDNHLCVDEAFERIYGSSVSSRGDRLLLGLDCIMPNDEAGIIDQYMPKWVTIYLQRWGASYVRYNPWSFGLPPSRNSWRSSPPLVAYVAPRLSAIRALALKPYLSFHRGTGMNHYLVCSQENLSINPSINTLLRGLEPPIEAGMIVSYHQLHEFPSMGHFIFTLAPSLGRSYRLVFLIGRSDPILLSHGSSLERTIWYGLLSLEGLLRHWTRLSEASKIPSHVNSVDPEFQDYVYGRSQTTPGL